MATDPGRAIERLDRFSRLWPLSACFGVFGLIAARALLEGRGAAAVVFGLLALGFLAALVRVLRVDDDGG